MGFSPCGWFSSRTGAAWAQAHPIGYALDSRLRGNDMGGARPQVYMGGERRVGNGTFRLTGSGRQDSLAGDHGLSETGGVICTG
jgi:hypothetical protein